VNQIQLLNLKQLLGSVSKFQVKDEAPKLKIVGVIICWLARALVLNRTENEHPKNYNRKIRKLLCSSFCKLYGTHVKLSKAIPITGRGSP
jgi:hypothetical protein